MLTAPAFAQGTAPAPSAPATPMTKAPVAKATVVKVVKAKKHSVKKHVHVRKHVRGTCVTPGTGVITCGTLR